VRRLLHLVLISEKVDVPSGILALFVSDQLT
jgi:hypothetical protein